MVSGYGALLSLVGVSATPLFVSRPSANGRLFFPRGSEVDGIWRTLARSVVNGPLNKAGVELIKVASAPKSFSEEQVVSDCAILELILAYAPDLSVYGRRVR